MFTIKSKKLRLNYAELFIFSYDNNINMADAQMPLLSQTEDGEHSYSKMDIPSFDDLRESYNRRWSRKKEISDPIEV